MRVWVVSALVALVAPLGAEAQVAGGPGGASDEPENCELIENQFVYIRVMGDGSSNSYVSGPMEVRCDGNVRIRADSAVIFEASGYSQLFGNVLFEDALKQLTADRATYFGRDRRLIALGDGRIVDKVRSSVITGDTIVYARANRFRPEDLLNVTGGSPHAVLFPPEREPELPSENGEAADSVGSEPAEGDPGPLGRGGERAPRTVDVPAELPDSLAESSDSLAPLRDSVAESSDSLAPLPDSLATPPDGLMTLRDSIGNEGVGVARADTEPGAQPADTAARAQRGRRDVHYEIDAVRFSIAGDRYFRAEGDVVIEKDSLDAYGDSLRYDQQAGGIVLMGSARIDEDAFELTGDSILFADEGTASQTIRAIGRSALVGQDVDLTAPEIRVTLRESLLDRLMAVEAPPAEGAQASQGPPARTEPAAPGPVGDSATALPAGRPRAIAQDFVLVGDSIEVLAPGERLEEVVAMGSARGESVARDSLNDQSTPAVARRDWLEGDRITVHFSPAADAAGQAVVATDGTGRPQVQIDSLVSTGSARTLYRMTPSNETGTPVPGRLALHYVRASEITIHLAGGEVESMEVRGQAHGYHLEPALDQPLAPAVPDSARADTAASPPEAAADTAGPPIGRDGPPAVSLRSGLPPAPDRPGVDVPGPARAAERFSRRAHVVRRQP